MDYGNASIDDIINEICYRCDIEDLEEAERLFCKALQDQEVQEIIYNKVHELVLDR